jgi:hypothetical protein
VLLVEERTYVIRKYLRITPVVLLALALTRESSTTELVFRSMGNLKTSVYFKNKEEAIAARAAANIKYNFHENHGRKEANVYGY